MDGIDKVGLADGGESFGSNETTQQPAAAFDHIFAAIGRAQRCEGRLAQLVRAPALQAGPNFI